MLRFASILLGTVLLLAAGSSAVPAADPAPAPRASPMMDSLPTWTGTWRLDKDRSTAVDPWRDFTVVIERQGDAVILKRSWRGSREGGTFTDSVQVVPGGPPATVKLVQWPDNRHLGAYIGGDSTKTVTARWADDGRTLVTESRLTVSIQQGERAIRIYSEYRLDPDGSRLDLLELRSTRPNPLHYVFTRAAE